MLNKYVHFLETREIYEKTGAIWRVYDVPTLWRGKAISKVEEDGYVILDDGTVEKGVGLL